MYHGFCTNCKANRHLLIGFGGFGGLYPWNGAGIPGWVSALAVGTIEGMTKLKIKFFVYGIRGILSLFSLNAFYLFRAFVHDTICSIESQRTF